MQSQRSDLPKTQRNKTALYYLAIFITGGGIGWLTGLSVSPTISIVITSVTGSAAAIIAAMSGIEKNPTNPNQSENNEKTKIQWDVNPLPLAALVIGLVGGSIFGIYVRNNNLLGSDMDVAIEIQKWSAFGIQKQDVVNRLFDINFPSDGQLVSSPGQSILTGTTVLFSVSSDQCDILRAASIRTEVEGSDALANALRRIETLKSLPDVVEDPELLTNIVEKVICSEN